MSFCLRPNVCKKCGKPLTMFEGWVCLECEKAEQKPTVQEKQANADKIDAVYIDGFKAGYEQARFDYEQETTDAVSRGAFEQVMYERDIAIEQLHELGYEWGQKIEPCDDAVSREAVLNGLRGCICDEWVKTLFATMVKQLPSVNPQPCDDAISREDVIAEMEELNAVSFYEANEHSKEAYYEIKNMIKTIPSVTQKAGGDKKCGSYNNTNTFKSCSDCKLIGTDTCYMVCGGSKSLYKPK